MSEEQPNVIRLRRALQAFNDNDLETVRTYVSDEVVYRIVGKSRVAGTYHGIDGLHGILQRVKELSDDTIAVEPQVLVADGGNIMMLARITAARAGKTLDIDHCYYYRFNDDGLLVEGRTMPVDLYAFDAFWA